MYRLQRKWNWKDERIKFNKKTLNSFENIKKKEGETFFKKWTEKVGMRGWSETQAFNWVTCSGNRSRAKEFKGSGWGSFDLKKQQVAELIEN